MNMKVVINLNIKYLYNKYYFKYLIKIYINMYNEL